jgi:FHA domain-containing protein
VIIIEVTTVNGQPSVDPLAAEFDELGGNIGRADGNTLVLSDPEKVISRRHASIAFRNGRYVVCDHGTATPVYVNGRAVGNGQEAPIDVGDELRIGGFTLAVKPGATAPAPVAPVAHPAAGESRDDPLELLGRRGGGGGVFDDLREPVRDTRAAPARPPRATSVDPLAAAPGAGRDAGSGMAIPPDFDPFAPQAPAAAPQGASGPLIPDDFDVLRGAGSGAPSIDKLFDLEPGARGDPFEPGHPIGEPISQPNTAARSDPLASLRASPGAGSASPTQRDDVPEVRGSFRLPEAKLDPVARPPAPARDAQANGMIVSWTDAAGPPDRIKTVVIHSRPTPPPDAAPRRTDPFGNQWRDTKRAAPPAPPAPTPASPPAQPPQPTASDAELLRAFLAGAGVPELKLPPLSPKLMEIFGQLLREATKGTLDLLAARAITKREMRADMTVIVAAENNPLKFSPNAEAAMSHLLSPQGRGFMTPLRAMRDAYDDLRAHQFAFVAGMRAALAGVLARFDPGTLEQRLTEKSMIDSVLPMNRKAKLWGLFEQLHSDIQREAEDDFDALFGREFLRAYEAQLARLEREAKNRGA